MLRNMDAVMVYIACIGIPLRVCFFHLSVSVNKQCLEWCVPFGDGYKEVCYIFFAMHTQLVLYYTIIDGIV